MNPQVSTGLLALSTLGTLGALACEQDDARSDRPRTEVRDSAGIQIIENASPADGSRLPWQIGPGTVRLDWGPRRRGTVHAPLRPRCHNAV